MKLYKNFLVLALVLLVAACAKTTSIRKSANFNIANFHQSEVLVLPNDAFVEEVSFGGKKTRMYEYESHMQKIIDDKIWEFLKNKGLNAKIINEKTIASSKLFNNVVRIKEDYLEQKKSLYSKFYEEEVKAFGLENKISSSSALFKDKLNKILVISDFSSYTKNTGARTAEFAASLFLGALSGVSSNNSEAGRSVLTIMFIDQQTGDVLWSNASVDIEDTFSGMFVSKNEDEKIAKSMVESVLIPLFEKNND